MLGAVNHSLCITRGRYRIGTDLGQILASGGRAEPSSALRLGDRRLRGDRSREDARPAHPARPLRLIHHRPGVYSTALLLTRSRRAGSSCPAPLVPFVFFLPPAAGDRAPDGKSQFWKQPLPSVPARPVLCSVSGPCWWHWRKLEGHGQTLVPASPCGSVRSHRTEGDRSRVSSWLEGCRDH